MTIDELRAAINRWASNEEQVALFAALDVVEAYQKEAGCWSSDMEPLMDRFEEALAGRKEGT